jgi:hypothetical protein
MYDAKDACNTNAKSEKGRQMKMMGKRLWTSSRSSVIRHVDKESEDLEKFWTKRNEFNDDSNTTFRAHSPIKDEKKVYKRSIRKQINALTKKVKESCNLFVYYLHVGYNLKFHH